MQISEDYPSLYRKMFVSFELSFKSLFFGRKWLIYILLALFPLAFTLLTPNRLLGNDTVEEAFVDLFLITAVFFFFTFGCLIISLPFSADEITDHLIDLYIVRPIPREGLFLSRWLAYHLALVIVNVFIAVFYYLFLHIVVIDFSGDLISEITSSLEMMYTNIDVLAKSFLVILYGAIAYGGLFLLIGFIGSKAFTIGMIVALFERITNLQTIAAELFDPLFRYNPSTEVPDFILSQFYLIFLAIVFLVLGLLFIRRKEFE
ncbi:MAG: hypothetical protein ACW981_16110 [Candidatus Hodarchaeales archaeon]|jgi:hypothetical protein